MANWPFSDITPNDIARFAARGQWSKVAKAARLASRKAAKTPPFKVSIIYMMRWVGRKRGLL